MKYGLTSEELIYFEKNLIIPLKASGATVWIFGSRARGDHKKFSDIDILVRPSTKEVHTLISKIKEVFEEENFPYKIDITCEDDLAASYRENVMNDKRQL